MKLTRTQAIAKYGVEAIESIDNAPCEPTGRLIYPAFEPEHAGMVEFATQTEPAQAYYYQPEGADVDNAAWEIDHYEDMD